MLYRLLVVCDHGDETQPKYLATSCVIDDKQKAVVDKLLVVLDENKRNFDMFINAELNPWDKYKNKLSSAEIDLVVKLLPRSRTIHTIVGVDVSPVIPQSFGWVLSDIKKDLPIAFEVSEDEDLS